MKSQTPTYHLNIGDLIVSPSPALVSTVLGSCVSVCLFAKNHSAGGMIHFAHPKMSSQHGQQEDYRYGDVAISALIKELQTMTGDEPQTFIAKIVGGASDSSQQKKTFDVGAENIKIAREILGSYGIPIIGESVGGMQGRKVLFQTHSGRLQVAMLSETIKKKNPSPSEQVKILSQFAIPEGPKKRKILIVDDSKVIQDLLKRIFKGDSDLEVIGSAFDVVEAAKMIAQERPDVITLDIQMPIMTGVEWLEKFLPQNPIPVVMISSMQFQEGNEVFRALELGAVDYIQKPSLSELGDVGPIIREKVKEASFAKVRRQQAKSVQPMTTSIGDLDFRKILLIGASTGGTEALKTVMCSLPAKIPPTLIVQHIPPVFSKTFADRLNELCPFEVKEAEDGDEVQASRVLIAPGGKQMKLKQSPNGLRVSITDDPPVSRHKPSVDYLFHSAAEILGKNAVGVILTGMGADGSKGLLEMRNKGARTIGQDEESCVVYGMPRVAFEIGAVEKVVSLTDVPAAIFDFLSSHKKSA